VYFTIVGGTIGSFVQYLATGVDPPVMGFVLGGLCFFALHEALRPE
jgi:hypothetical protein